MVAVAAFPTPGAARSHSSTKFLRQHPPYKDMIVKAIAALKNQKGSSRQAISKYIVENYKGLSRSHHALLSKHLCGLKLKGVIRMINLSYQLTEAPASFSSGSAAGYKRRGRPPKNSLNAPIVHHVSPKKRGRPQKFEAEPPPFKMNKAGQRLNPKSLDAVDSANIYILPQAKLLKSGFVKSLPGALAIILPQDLLRKTAARSPVLILPNGFQSLFNSSFRKNKMKRTRKEVIQKMPELPKNVVKRQPVQQKKYMVRKQVQLLRNEDVNQSVKLVARKLGRPRKINNFELYENLQSKSVNNDKFAGVETALGMLKNAEHSIMSDVGLPKSVVKMQHVQLRNKSMARNQVQLLCNEDMNKHVNLVERKRGRPRKINNFALPENLQLKSVNEDKFAGVETTFKILKNAEHSIMSEVGQGKQESSVFLLKRRSAGRPRKNTTCQSSSYL